MTSVLRRESRRTVKAEWTEASQAEKGQQQLGADGAGFSLRDPRRNQPCQGLRAPGLWRMHLCCLKPLGVWSCYRTPGDV